MKRWQAEIALFTIVVVWGSTFFVVRDAVQQWPPIAFVALRFSIAALVLAPWTVLHVRPWKRTDWRAATLLGGLLLIGFVTQTLGLERTTASRGGFLTGLNVVLVPLFGALLWRMRVRPQVWLGVALAVGGLFILSRDSTAQGQTTSWVGDGLVLICAVMFAWHILGVGRWAHGRSMLALTGVQIGIVAILATLLSLVVEGVPSLPPRAVVMAALYLGVVATAGVLVVQVAAQRVASPTHTALMFALEPVFAALFASVFGGEQLSVTFIWGGLLMFAGIIVAEVPLRRRVEHHREAI